MNNLSKVITGILATVMILSTAACGNGNSASDNRNEKESNDFTDSAEYTIDATGSPYAEGIKLKPLKDATVVYMTNTTWEFICNENLEESPTPYYHAMKIWKEVYGTDVTIELVDWDSYTNHLITAVASGEAPDVMRYYEETRHPVWPVRNLIAPLEDYMSLDDPDYNIEYSKRLAINGKIYALFGQSMNLPRKSIVYNKTKLEQAGKKTPLDYAKDGEWTWTNFVKLCKEMTRADKNDYGLGGWGMPSALPLVYLAADGKVVNNIDNPDYRTFYSKMYDLVVTDGAVRRSSDRMERKTTMPKGQDAMSFIETQEYPQILKEAKESGGNYEFGIAPIPVYDYLGDTGVRGANNCTFVGMAISAAPKNPEAAAEFVRLVTKVATNITKKSGKFGVLTNSLSEDEKEVFGNLKYEKDTDFVDIQSAITGASKYQDTIWGSANVTKTAAQLLEADKANLEASIAEFENTIG